jgi:hypothetical protein
LQQGPWKVLDSYIYTLTLRIGPQKKLESLQCGPPTPAGGGPAKIRRSPAAGSAGNARGAVLGLLGTGFDRSPRRWGSWRSRAKAAAAASRGMPGSGELPAGARERTARSTPVEGRGGHRTVARPRKLVGTRLGGGGHGGQRRSKERRGEAHTA